MGILIALLHDLPGWILISLGFYFAYRVLRFPDFTVDASYIIGTVATAFAAIHWSSSWAGLFFALFLGGFTGMVTSLVYLSNPRPSNKLLAGALVVFGAYSLNWRLLEKQTNVGFANESTFMNVLANYQAQNFPHPWNIYRPLTWLVGVLLVVIVILAFTYLLRTQLGLKLRSVGTRPKLISPVVFQQKFHLFLGLVISNMTVALGGWYLASLNSFADLQQFGTIIHALAAALLGELLYERFKIGKDRRVSVSFLVVAPVLGATIYQATRAVIFWALSNKDLHGKELSINQQDNNTSIAVLLLVSVWAVRYFTNRNYKIDMVEEGEF